VSSITIKTTVKSKGGSMKKFVGIWLDHRKAVVVSLTKNRLVFDSNQELLEYIESNIERRVRLSGGSRSRKTPYGPQEISVDSKQEDRVKRQLRKYYQQIIQKINDADRILIFGPSEAKVELKKEIEKSGQLGKRIQKVESADKMTQKQIVAKVKKVYSPYL
jgi:hypothetical protein